MMVHLRVGSGAERAEGSLKQADLDIRTMTKPPALSALGEADAFLGRSNDKAVPAIHERLPDEVLHGETAAGVMDIEPHCPRIRGTRVSRKARGMTFIQMDHSSKRRFHEDLVESRPWNREEMSVITSSRFQPVVQEVANLEARLRGRDLTSQLAIGGLLCISEEELKYLQISGIRNNSGLQG